MWHVCCDPSSINSLRILANLVIAAIFGMFVTSVQILRTCSPSSVPRSRSEETEVAVSIAAPSGIFEVGGNSIQCLLRAQTRVETHVVQVVNCLWHFVF